MFKWLYFPNILTPFFRRLSNFCTKCDLYEEICIISCVCDFSTWFVSISFSCWQNFFCLFDTFIKFLLENHIVLAHCTTQSCSPKNISLLCTFTSGEQTSKQLFSSQHWRYLEYTYRLFTLYFGCLQNFPNVMSTWYRKFQNVRHFYRQCTRKNSVYFM